MTSGRRWYLVRSLAGREISAERQLQNQGYSTFLPKRVKTVRHARKIRSVVGAYFPCYLFVSLDLSLERWRSINGTFGVSHIIMAGEQPAAVPTGIVEALIESADPRGILSQTLAFAPGQRIRIIAGPFADQLAVIDRLDDAGRVRVLLDIVGGVVPVNLDQGQLAKVI